VFLLQEENRQRLLYKAAKVSNVMLQYPRRDICVIKKDCDTGNRKYFYFFEKYGWKTRGN